MRQIPAQRLCQKTSRGYVGSQRRQKGMFISFLIFDFSIISARTSINLEKPIILLGVLKTTKNSFLVLKAIKLLNFFITDNDIIGFAKSKKKIVK